MLAPWKKSYDQPRQHIKKQRHYFANKCPSSQSYGLSNSYVWMWELDHKESWRRIDAFELWCWRRLLRVPWTAVHSKGNQSWIFIGRTDAEADAPIFWPPDVNSQLTGKDPDAGKEGDRGRDGWVASLAQWTWVWANSGRQWRTEKPGVLQFTGLQRVRHNLETEQ